MPHFFINIIIYYHFIFFSLSYLLQSYYCKSCDHSHPGLRELHRHREEAHGVLQYKCPYCNYASEDPEMIRRGHGPERHGNRPRMTKDEVIRVSWEVLHPASRSGAGKSREGRSRKENEGKRSEDKYQKTEKISSARKTKTGSESERKPLGEKVLNQGKRKERDESLGPMPDISVDVVESQPKKIKLVPSASNVTSATVSESSLTSQTQAEKRSRSPKPLIIHPSPPTRSDFRARSPAPRTVSKSHIKASTPLKKRPLSNISPIISQSGQGSPQTERQPRLTSTSSSLSSVGATSASTPPSQPRATTTSFSGPSAENSSSVPASDAPSVHSETMGHYQEVLLQASTSSAGTNTSERYGDCFCGNMLEGRVLAAENQLRTELPDGRIVTHTSREWLPREMFAERTLPAGRNITITTPLVPSQFPTFSQVDQLTNWLGGCLNYPRHQRAARGRRQTSSNSGSKSDSNSDRNSGCEGVL